MKITEDVRKFAEEQGMSEEEALKKGMEEKSKEFPEALREGVNLNWAARQRRPTMIYW